MSEYQVKKLRRTDKGRIVAGVCSGVGEFVGIDANVVRIALAILTLFGGLGIGIYAIGWLLIPDEKHETSILQDLVSKQQQRRSATDWSGEHKPQP
ncbi:Phage shock protein PspC (stress-responsive transcriptional regulator) [Nonomuraea maritima]|uniref:Phage shock protein PspC (Stress-responsive transcriptional regulator) n=1 Tax=Nonomuraea maritima TaxID=683260 RepID=A0A1G9RIG8_9ACTN|nr:PspC domain-containing protein [Nonomuraea maritima]SDM22993.1 Phage shock protein PspC (stress-responsive transcriptional regulator) [Nonomuraea maritima]